MIISRSKLLKMSEAELTTRVLLPLFKKMGFQDVIHYHGGSGEKGKDIIMWKHDDIRGRVNYGVVVKSQKISGQAAGRSSAAEVRFQIEQSFGSTYSDPITAGEQRIDRCFVVSSKEIKKEAIDAIEGILKQNNLNKVTSFINGDKLYEFMEEHLPEATVLEKFQEIQKILDNASPHYRILANQHQNGLQISLVPKYAGAEKEHPINFSLKVDFPDTTEAQEIKGAFERHIATGEPVTITKQYIGKLGIPEFLRSTLQIGTENIGGITLKQEPSKKPFIASFEAESNDAQKTELEYVDLRAVQIGKEEITLTNDNQPVPWKTKLVLNYKEKKMIFTCSVKVSEYLCHRVLQGLKFLETLSKGCVFKITHLDSGFILQNEIIKSGVYPSPNAELIKLVEALDFIQTKVQVPLCIPNTNFSNEEVKTIYETSHKIKTGQVKFGVKDLTISTDKAGAGTILSNYKNNKLSDFKVELEEFVNIFGISIPMGQVTYICYNAYIDKEDLALLRKLLRKPDQEQFSIRFKPSGDKTISAYYHRWKSD